MRSERIKQILTEAFSPVLHFELQDESHMHAGRTGQESHFKLMLVSDVFSGQNRVQRQRQVNELLAGEFEQGLHALSMRLLTQEESSKLNIEYNTPDCQGSKQS